MQNLFFFPKDRTLCWVAGYTQDGNTSNVIEIIYSLRLNAEKFSWVSGVAFEHVKTYFVEKSRHYKYMRCFYAQLPEDAKVPEMAFVCREDSDMFEFLTD